VIRFSCPHCDRRYELPDALARLALVCKGCGQPMPVPETSTVPEPAPPPPPPPRVPMPVPVPEPAKAESPPEPSPAKSVVAVSTNESRLPPPHKPTTNGPLADYPIADELFESPDPLAALGKARPTPPPIPPAVPRERKLLGTVVDIAAALVLVVVGVFCGELLARQSTGEVLKEAASAAKFPPVELMMWLAPTLLLLLVYALLISRGKSIGRIVRRRMEA
jgi:hypothetical protein